MTARPNTSPVRLRQSRWTPIALASLCLALLCAVWGYAPDTADAKKRDRDRDGLSDRYEVRVSKTSIRRKDTDRDGLRDRYEVRKSRTRPRRPDTDRDGLRDGYEVRKSKTNPRRKDTDGDGLSDRFELRVTKTNPRRKDTDGDGVNDGVERRQGSDPRDPNSRGPNAGPSSNGPTHRDIPVSPAGYLGQFNLSSRSYQIANRFVLDDTQTIDRWYQTLIAEGTTCVGGRGGYGHGNGGLLWGRIVEVNQTTGLPTGRVLAEERVNGCTGWLRAKNEFGLPQLHSTQYFQFPAVTLQANRMYAFLLSNLDPNPGNGGGGTAGGNHLSADTNFAKLSQMGPHGKNNLNPNASGAMYGLDPRETTMWSDNSGGNWDFGDQVGWYQQGSGEGRMWNGAGYRIAGSHVNVAHGWPYINWPGEGSATVTMKNSPKAVTVTRAGGASSNGSVGTVTVRNTRTGVSGRTSSLGSGVQRGTLDNPVPIARGDSYTITNTGVVDTGDGGKAPVFGLGNRGAFDYASSGSQVSASTDRPMLFATPHPYY